MQRLAGTRKALSTGVAFSTEKVVVSEVACDAESDGA